MDKKRNYKQAELGFFINFGVLNLSWLKIKKSKPGQLHQFNNIKSDERNGS